MNPSIIFVAISLFIWGMGEGMFYMFQPNYLTQLGADPVQIGFILGGAGAAMMLAHIPAGFLSDRIGSRPLLQLAWCIGVLSTWLMALATALPMFVAGLFLYGFTAFVSSPLNSYITSARGSWSVGRAITLVSATFTLGAVIGPFTGGWIGDNFGLRTVYFVAGGLFVISTIFIFLIAPQPLNHHDPASPPASLLGNRRYLGFLALGFFVILANYLPQPLTAKFLQETRELSLSQIGLLGTVGGVGNTLLTVGLGSLQARLGFILAQVGVAAFAFLLWQVSGLEWYALAYFLLGGFRAARSLFTAQIRPLVHASQVGLAYGIAETVAAVTIILAPIIAGFVYKQAPQAVYPLAFVAIIISIGLSLVFSPHPTHPQLQE